MEKYQHWRKKKCWIAFFDILGFKNLINQDDNEYVIYSIISSYESALSELESASTEFRADQLNYTWFSDSFVIHSSDDSGLGYSVIEGAAKRFISNCIYRRIPLRGAIAVGPVHFTNDGRTFIGKTFVEAYKYGEDQDWLGLIITPNAVEKAESYNLFPARHAFTKKGIPMKTKNDNNIYAYTFCDGPSNFDSPFIPMLKEMKNKAQSQRSKAKYERTIEFINKNRRKI